MQKDVFYDKIFIMKINEIKNKILIIFIYLLLTPLIVNAKSYGTVNDYEGINVRSIASTSGNILGAVAYGSTLELVDKTLHNIGDLNCNAGWYKVKYVSGNYTEGYVCSLYLNIYDTPTINTNKDYEAKVDCASYISVWSTTLKDWNNIYSTLLDKLITGTSVTVLEEVPSTNTTCLENWYLIKYQNGKTGYVCSDDLSLKEELVLDSSEYTEEELEYANGLKNLGFPDSYIIYLMRMKRNHPNWNFIPYLTNLNFPDVVSGEDGKNKIESTTTTYLNHYISSPIGTEGGNWYYTNYDTNAFFLDPRNFLTERFIFMFEDLSYNTTFHTNEVLSLFLNGTWLNTDEIKSYFFEAAQNHSVSPLHLAARIFKEGGSDSSYGPITGTYNGYLGNIYLYGYYNFYNIGAYSDWVQGLCFAAGHLYSDGSCITANYTSYGRPWTTIKKGIIGGAEFISADYIKPGQNTLYFQKFNVKVAPYYTHQYMTNIMAPTQEAETMYKNLKSMNLLDKNYTFIIPVYNNLPENVALPSAASSDNTLKSITINDKQIENFDKDVIEYVYYVQEETQKINVNALANDSGATLSGIGEIPITNAETTISIIVKAENGSTKTYKLIIKKVEGVKTLEEITSSLSTKINGNYMSGIKELTDTSSLINTIKKADPSSSILYNNKSSLPSSYIKTGDALKITSSSGQTGSYTLIVTGDVSGDGSVTILDLLKVQKHILKSSLLSETYALAGDTNSDNKVDILDLLRVQKHILTLGGIL